MNKFSIWNFNGINNSYLNLYLLKDTADGLYLHLFDRRDNNYTLRFKNYYGYRVFNESYRFRLLKNHPELSTKNAFYISNSSEFVDWLYIESHESISSSNINHFIIVTDDEVIDILIDKEPELIDENRVA